METENEKRFFLPLQDVVSQANVQEYDQMYQYSLDQPEAFWAKQADQLSWYKKWDNVLDKSNPPFFKWFEGGKTNIILNAIDRHLLSATRNKLAIIWGRRTGRLQNFLVSRIEP